MHPPAPPNPPQPLFRRPLTDILTAQTILDREQESIMCLVDTGDLRAFNVSAEIHYKRTVRIVADDIVNAQRGGTKPPDDFAALLKLMFPFAPAPRAGVIATVKANTIARRLNVSSTHVYHLIEQGWLKLAPGHKARRGPTGSPPVVFDSLVTFLRQRRIT